MSPRPMPNFFKVAQTALCMKKREISAAGSVSDASVYTSEFQSVRERTNARTLAPHASAIKKKAHAPKIDACASRNRLLRFSYRSTVSVTVVVCVIPPPLAVIVIVWFPVLPREPTVTFMVEVPEPGAAILLGVNVTV